MPADPESEAIERRDFLRRTLAGVSALALAGVAGAAARRSAQQPRSGRSIRRAVHSANAAPRTASLRCPR